MSPTNCQDGLAFSAMTLLAWRHEISHSPIPKHFLWQWCVILATSHRCKKPMALATSYRRLHTKVWEMHLIWDKWKSHDLQCYCH